MYTFFHSFFTFNLAVTKKTVGDREKLLTYLNSALKVPSGLDIFPRGTKKKLNFVYQCNQCIVLVYYTRVNTIFERNYIPTKFALFSHVTYKCCIETKDLFTHGLLYIYILAKDV
jgi:hypothetical protein